MTLPATQIAIHLLQRDPPECAKWPVVPAEYFMAAKGCQVLLAHLDAGQKPLEAIATAYANQQISGGRMRELIEYWLAGADVMNQLPDDWNQPNDQS